MLKFFNNKLQNFPESKSKENFKFPRGRASFSLFANLEISFASAQDSASGHLPLRMTE